jgi:thiosulfate/3-mercaptopyruvate sulfurtransferase
MPNTPSKWLVDTDWLALHMDAPGVVVLDGSLHLPTTGRNAKVEYDAGHIPGALFFDINDIADKANPLPHMMPGPIPFSSRMKKMGVGDGMRIVVYDTEGFYSAARVWWMFRVMGHDDVAVLDGGLKKMCRRANGQRAISPRVSTLRLSTTGAMYRTRSANLVCRSSMRGPPHASPAPCQSRAKACVPDTSRRRRTWCLPTWSMPTAP